MSHTGSKTTRFRYPIVHKARQSQSRVRVPKVAARTVVRARQRLLVRRDGCCRDFCAIRCFVCAVQVWLLEAEAWSVERITSGALAVVWLVFIAYWTIGSIRAGAPVAFTLFSLPFWICGAMMVDPVLVPLRRTILWHADLQSLRAYSPYSRTRARRHACIVRHSRGVSGPVVFDPFHPSAFGCCDRRHRQSTQPLPPHACAHACSSSHRQGWLCLCALRWHVNST